MLEHGDCTILPRRVACPGIAPPRPRGRRQLPGSAVDKNVVMLLGNSASTTSPPPKMEDSRSHRSGCACQSQLVHWARRESSFTRVVGSGRNATDEKICDVPSM